MICKKCGSDIADTSKFCGVCGQKVEEVFPTNLNNDETIDSKVEENPSVVTPFESEPVVQEVNPVVEGQPEVLNNNVDPTNSVEQTTIIPPVSPEQPEKESKKKNYTWMFVVGGVLLGVIAIALVLFAYSKNSNSSVKVLEKALSNIEEKGENSGTIDASILIQSDTEDSINLSATIKYAKQYDDNYNFALTLNKSMFFDEINVYATLLDDNLTLFANSSLIDMLGFTASTSNMWVHLIMTEEELEITDEVDVEDDGDYYLRDVLDEKHFKLIDEENGLSHYQLVIDNELLNKIKAQAPSQEELKEFEDTLASINNGSTELTETYYVELYIDNNNELVKVAMDLTNELDDETVKKAVLSFEFKNFGNTLVQIPDEAKNSTIDLETYMSTYAIMDESYDETYDTTYDDTTLTDEYNYQY